MSNIIVSDCDDNYDYQQFSDKLIISFDLHDASYNDQ